MDVKRSLISLQHYKTILALLLAPGLCSHRVTAGETSALKDVEAAFERIADERTTVRFPLGNLNLPEGGHIQGVQLKQGPRRDRVLAFLSHDSRSIGYVVVATFDSSLKKPGKVVHVQRFAENGLRHAGGIQLLDDVLVVGMEDNQAKDRSEIQFWDTADPGHWRQLSHLTIPRSGPPKKQTAGAVGIVRMSDHVVVAVANWDSRDIDFYRSTESSLSRPDCRFQHVGQWSVASADRSTWQPDRNYGSYQSFNLLRQSDDQLYLCGCHQSGRGADVADLFAVHPDAAPNEVLEKRASKQVVLSQGSHFRYGGGVHFREGDLWLLSTQRSLREQVLIDIVR